MNAKIEGGNGAGYLNLDSVRRAEFAALKAKMQKAETDKPIKGAEPKTTPPVKKEPLLHRWARWRDNIVLSIVADD